MSLIQVCSSSLGSQTANILHHYNNYKANKGLVKSPKRSKLDVSGGQWPLTQIKTSIKTHFSSLSLLENNPKKDFVLFYKKKEKYLGCSTCARL